MLWQHNSFDVPWVAPDLADSEGFVGMGGDLSIPLLLRAYREGIFPWYNEGDPILWWSPDPRAIFEFEDFHISRRLARTIRSGKFSITFNQAFPSVIAHCAQRPEGTWITRDMMHAYITLHQYGYAHSVESWFNGRLAGGVYGVAIGAFFAAESMFFSVSDGSKVALVSLISHLKSRGFTLVDTQIATEHTKFFGAQEIFRSVYIRRLNLAIRQSNITFLPRTVEDR